ncbi:Fe-only nitrogenase accessory AnfO family protein [Desulfocucumis palustris]|nr:Fe-only nitrogenase accessory AnfO family protein [Desulfocucumis palustris]
MPKDIAVFVDKNGYAASLNEPGKLIVFRKKMGKWSTLREKEFSLENTLEMKELRRKMGEILFFLQDCKTIVGSTIVGIPYFELEKSHFSIWEYEGKALEMLDYVLEREEEAEGEKAVKGEIKVQTAPVEYAPGCYRISLKEIQEGGTGVTSKQALLPFLRKGRFYSLEILCSHIPPWLEAELTINSLDAGTEKTGAGDIRITISKKCCQNCN